MLKITYLVLFLAFTQAHAAAGDWFFLPTVGIGYNSVQGNSMRFGLDLGVYFEENLYGGVGAYYAAGSHPEHDREMGAGPFVGYSYPVVTFLTLGLREDIDWIDERTPVLNSGNPDYYTHDEDHGVISYTYAGVHLSFTRNFGVSAGWRAALGLSKASLANGRSGPSFGLTIGI